MDIAATFRELIEKAEGPADAVAAAAANGAAWLSDPRLAGYLPYIETLVRAGAGDLLLDSFWRVIPFGTGGRRGPVGAGPNRINPHTIALSVQGHCDFLRQAAGDKEALAVTVAFDVRRFYDMRGLYPGIDGVLKDLTSRDLARMSAMTYAANGVVAYLVGPLEDEPGRAAVEGAYISTPELSFLIRELGCAGGLNISASHNHPDDNGGKFYNSDGGQEVPPDDEALLETVNRVAEVKTMPYAEAREKGLIRFVPPSLHDAYIGVNTALCPTASRSARVGYSPLSGTGVTTVKEALSALKFDLRIVPSQSVPDGSFRNVRYRIANPEVPDSMDRLRELLVNEQCDIGIATDPDADRLGLLAPDGGGDFRFINGNEIGILLIEGVLQAGKRAGTLPDAPIFINTLVTTSLQRKIARAYGCKVVGDLMVGFKYMGDVMRHLEVSGRFPPAGEVHGRDTVIGSIDDFIFTTEESHGYLLTPRVRDKDACGAAVFLAGLASDLKDRGRTLTDFLDDIYRVYGYTACRLRSMVMEGIAGLARIGRIQSVLRENPPTEIAGLKVVRFVDNWKKGGPLKSETDRAGRNVLLFELESGCDDPIRLVVRPSGTEPKTKIYVEVPSAEALGGTLFDATEAQLAAVDRERSAQIKARADKEADRIATAFVRYCLGAEVLGDAFPEVPTPSLLVSDLVPLEQKLRLCTHILPSLAARIDAGDSDSALQARLAELLGPFGEDPVGLVRTAVDAWIGEEHLSGPVAARLSALFCIRR